VVSGFAAPAVAAFDRADEYDAHARVQRRVAAWLAGHLAELPRPARLLEVGGGTGFLRAAAGPLADEWLLTDLSPAMLDRARVRLEGAPDLRFAMLDATRPDGPEPPFDLVVGSLVVQWFDDLAGGLARLLGRVAPGGRLVVTTLAAGTFGEWQAAHAAEGLIAATPAYPPVDRLAALRLPGAETHCRVRDFPERHPDGRAFLRTLKAIGAATPRRGHRPLGPAALNRVMRRWEADGATVCYRVAMLSFLRVP
jgi:malonyl-CoA O-methyltransferase